MLQTAMLESQIELQKSQAGKNKAEELRILGLTGPQVNSALSRANQDIQKETLLTIQANIASQTQQAKINKIVEEALLMKEKVGFEKAKAQFTTLINDVAGVPLHFMKMLIKKLFSKPNDDFDINDPNTWDLPKID
jgi:hypothetical protein